MLTSKLWNAFGDIEVLGVYTTIGILNGIDTWLTVMMMVVMMIGLLAHSTITIAVSDPFVVTPIEVFFDFLNVGIVAEKDSNCFLLHSLCFVDYFLELNKNDIFPLSSRLSRALKDLPSLQWNPDSSRV